MMRNTTRAVLALIFTALGSALANVIVEKLFGPEDEAA